LHGLAVAPIEHQADPAKPDLERLALAVNLQQQQVAAVVYRADLIGGAK
jgi:hypothetical protein